MDTYNFQCLVIQSTSDTGVLSLPPEILFFYLGSWNWNSGQSICWFSFRLDHLYMRGKHTTCWTLVLDWVGGGIQTDTICNRRYLKTMSKQDSFIFYPKINKHAVVWHLKLDTWNRFKMYWWWQQKFPFKPCFMEQNLFYMYIYLLIWYELI